MATEAQIKANQENAKKSTGPATEEGKQRSSMNAMTQGIFANIPILPGENEIDLNELKAQIIQALKPTDAIELGFVERIIQSRFRQIRLREAEAAKLKISMMPEVLAESITHILKHSTFKNYIAEDLPAADQDVVTDNPLMLIAKEVTDHIELGNIKSAHERCEGLNQKDKLGVWSLLNAKTKLLLKKYLEA